MLIKSKPSELTAAGDFCFVFKRGMGGRRGLGDGGACGSWRCLSSILIY